jgi:hypothetical protein
MPVTRPARIVSDLLDDAEYPEAVAHVAADAIRAGHEEPVILADVLARYAARFRLDRGDGLGLLGWLLGLVGDADTQRWMRAARTHAAPAPAVGPETASAHRADRGA